MFGLRAAFTAALFVTAIGATGVSGAETRVEQIAYRGWQKCWRLSNGRVDLVFVPTIGRIMRYGRVGGPNVLWENEALVGKAPDPTAKDWQNYGGDKLWPAPQSKWGWPPDMEVDPGTHTVEVGRSNRLTVTGSPSRKHGVRFVRTISLASESSEVTITNAIENVSKEPVTWSVWEVAQVNDPAWAEIPIDRRGGLNLFDDPTVSERGLVTKGSIPLGGAMVRLPRHPKKSGKIGTDSSTQWARARIGDEIFTVLSSDRQTGEYPDKGCRQEIYSNADPAKYMELELLSPTHTLKPGERATFVTRWGLDKSKGDRTNAL